MTATYRILQFIANPCSGLRIPLAVVVRDDAGGLHVVAPDRPYWSTWVSAGGARLFQDAIQDMRDQLSMDPTPLGPQFIMTDVLSAPSGDPVGWARRLVFPDHESWRARCPS